jgi:hypothetical protein
MKRSLGSLLFLAAALFFQSMVFGQTQIGPIMAEANGISFSLTIRGDQAEVTVSAPVTGWVAVGFNPTSRMKDADFKIGYVKDGTVFARDDFGTGLISHGDDTRVGGTADLISSTGSEKVGRTTVTFIFPVDSKDIKDAVLTKGTHTIILGSSNSDSFTGMHNKNGKATIAIP